MTRMVVASMRSAARIAAPVLPTLGSSASSALGSPDARNVAPVSWCANGTIMTSSAKRAQTERIVPIVSDIHCEHDGQRPSSENAGGDLLDGEQQRGSFMVQLADP